MDDFNDSLVDEALAMNEISSKFIVSPSRNNVIADICIGIKRYRHRIRNQDLWKRRLKDNSFEEEGFKGRKYRLNNYCNKEIIDRKKDLLKYLIDKINIAQS